MERLPRTIAAAVLLTVLAGGCHQSQPPTTQPPTTEDGRVPIDPPANGSSASPDTPQASGEQVGEYFTVTADDVTYGGLAVGGDQLVSAQVKVCLTALPPGATNPVPVTMDQWSVRATSPIADRDPLEPWTGMQGAPGRGDFRDTELAVGQCAEGKLPFLVVDGAEPQSLDYSNDQGQKLSWPVQRAR